jgi:hypothetical protein
MEAQGIWELTIATPVGHQRAMLELVEDGSSIGGHITANGETIPLENPLVDGNRLTWDVAMTRPFKLNLAFEVRVNGDEITGHSKAMMFPRSTIVGHRKIETDEERA